jgi:hypothetical protein
MGKMIFAVVLSPGGIIAWLVVGLIAGWLAGLMMKGSGYGIIVSEQRLRPWSR